MKRLAILTLISALLISTIPSSIAAPCEQKVCIKVYTDPATGRVVIEAKKGKPKAESSKLTIVKMIDSLLEIWCNSPAHIHAPASINDAAVVNLSRFFIMFAPIALR